MLCYNFVSDEARRAALYKGTRKRLQQSMKQNLVGSSGLEPPTSRLSGVRSNHLSYEPISWSYELFAFFTSGRLTFVTANLLRNWVSSPSTGGDKRDRTADPLLAKQVLSQLSYTPISFGAFIGPLRTSKIKQRFFQRLPKAFLLCSS